ncbi:unnamed protein product [Closterium sp. NIES-64]|nr:unnamed protein product [Closterium sp. NIES-64]
MFALVLRAGSPFAGSFVSVFASPFASTFARQGGARGVSSDTDLQEVSETLAIVSLVKAFRDRGHYVAQLDPLGRHLGPLKDNAQPPAAAAAAAAADSSSFTKPGSKGKAWALAGVSRTSQTAGAGRKGSSAAGSSAVSALPEPENAPDLFRLLRNYPELDLGAVGLAGIDVKKRYFLGEQLRIVRAAQLFWTVEEVVGLLSAPFLCLAPPIILLPRNAHLAGTSWESSGASYFLGEQLRIVRAAQLFWTVEEVVGLLRNAYCRTSTVECAHLASRQQKRWVQAAMERPPLRQLFSPTQQRHLLHRLLYAGKTWGGWMRTRSVSSCGFPLVKRFGIEGGEALVPISHHTTHYPSPPTSTPAHLHTDAFERFLARKFPSVKRFGIEGGEALVPGLLALLGRAAGSGVKFVELGMAHRWVGWGAQVGGGVHKWAWRIGGWWGAQVGMAHTWVVGGGVHKWAWRIGGWWGAQVGMAHRGRLSVLHAVLGKPLSSILSEFKPPEVSPELSELLQVGDVKYHLGTRSTLEFESNQVQVSLLPNPSHLELVDPVVVGKARAKQLFTNDSSRRSVMGLILHGDAAFSGLGLAPEVLQLSDLPEYTTGGTIHVIINNQIGFTTDPKLARSSPHPSDFAKAVGAPIFHVNADDPEAVAHICSLAVDWRQTFGKDVVVDLVCYRRHGHNEQDDPRVTQPLMYSLVDSHPPCLQLYASRLMAEEVVTAEEIASWQADVEAEFERAFENTSKQQVSPQDWLAANWQGEALGSLVSQRKVQPTGLPLKTLQRVGDVLCTVPPDFTLHPQVALLLENRRKMMATGEGIDWAMAEALAFGSLLLPFDPSLNQTADSNPTHAVRLSGQDCERGTFNHRHAVMHEQTTGQRYTPLQHVAAGQERFMVCNSSLSEAAVLGFEYGFSLENENALVCWEAQFGDFANNAQAIIDNFIVSGEDKWMTPTGLVLLLPHGFDGQGPEHSSARLERYLQLVNDDADHLPGYSPHLAAQIEAGFTIADRDNKGHVSLSDLLEFMQSQYGLGHDYVTALAHQMHIDESNQISKADWESFMVRWMRRNAQRDNNVCVVNLTTPANYFHALRRQVNRHFSKPLVVMSPKYLLHHKPCASPLSHFTSGTFFQPVIADGDIGDNMRHLHADKLLPPGEMKRLVLCSGKIYYSLAHARRARKQWEVGLMRIEQLAPMAVDHVARVINSHSAAELVWAQEEPKNMGAWPYIRPRVSTLLHSLCPDHPATSAPTPIRFVGRAPSASPATAAASKTGRYGRSPSGSRDSPLAPSRSDQPSWRSAAAAPPPPAGPGAAGAGGGGSTGWGDSADGGRSAGGAAPGGAWARGGPGKNDNAWGRGGGAGAPGGARGGPGGNPWHTGGGGVGVLTGAWQQPLQHLQQPAPPPLSQQQAQLDQAQAGKGARKGDGGGALDRAGESANGGSANGGSAGDASVGAARAGGREWMVAVSACLIGHAVEVQLVQGDSYSGIFHAANEEDYGESAYASNKEDLEN